MRRMSFILAFLFLAAAFPLMIYLHSVKLATAALVICVYFVFFGFYGYLFSEMINYHRLQNEHGKAVVMIVDFMPVQVNVTVNKTKFSFKYSTITKAYETEDTYILVLQKSGMIEHGQVLYKNGFTNKDEADDFKKFINEKAGKEVFALGE